PYPPPVQVDPLSANLDVCLVHPPRSTDRTSVTRPAFLEFRQVVLDPAQNRRVSKRDTSIRHHDHQVSEAQFETGVPADTEDDDLRAELPPGNQSPPRNEPPHPAMIHHRRAVCTRATQRPSPAKSRWSTAAPVRLPQR